MSAPLGKPGGHQNAVPGHHIQPQGDGQEDSWDLSSPRARSRGIQGMVLNYYKGTVASTKKLVALSNWVREDVIWWLNHCRGLCVPGQGHVLGTRRVHFQVEDFPQGVAGFRPDLQIHSCLPQTSFFRGTRVHFTQASWPK